MFTSDDLRFVAALSRASSLAAAARELQVTPSAVTQRLQELERRAGLRLVDRSSRRIALTSEGELLAGCGARIAADLAGLGDELAARRGVVAGHLRILAPFGFGRRWLAPITGRFCRDHPEVRIELVLSDRFDRIPDASWDLAVHIGELRASSLEVHQLAPNDRIVCAAPRLLERFGTPCKPADLRDLPCLALRENDEDVTLWRFTDGNGSTTRVRIEPRLSCNDGEVIRGWAVDGYGFIARSEWSVHDDLQAGRLLRVLTDDRMPAAPVVALVGAQNRRTARTSVMLRYLQDALTPTPWRQPRGDRAVPI